MKRMILGAVVLGALAGAGCDVETRPAAVGLEYDVGPDVAFYDRGTWDGDYWVWHDRDGNVRRESRDVHTQRVAKLHSAPAHREEARPPEEHHEDKH